MFVLPILLVFFLLPLVAVAVVAMAATQPLRQRAARRRASPPVRR